MRHILFIVTVVLGGGFSIGCNGTTPAGPAETQGVSTGAESHPSADFRSASAHAALIIRSGGCGLIDGDGRLAFIDQGFIVATQSTRLNTTLICKVKHVANSSGRAVNYTSEDNPFGPGVGCGIALPDNFVVTAAWTETVSASGNATLRCHFKL
jgi:hypothetical protein